MGQAARMRTSSATAPRGGHMGMEGAPQHLGVSRGGLQCGPHCHPPSRREEMGR